jgi:UDP-N-acetylglucosamine 2-epimerase
MDDKTKDYLTQKGISEDRLVITGHPLIEYFASKRFTNKERIQVRKELKIPLNKKIIFIASEIIHYHSFYDACDTSIVKCCSLVDMNVKGIRLWKYLMEKYNTEDSVFIMRPHPNEKFKNLKKLHVVDWYKMDEITLLKSVDIMLGLTSMFVLLSVSAGVPTFNVEPLLNGWAPHNSFLRPELWKYLASHGFLGNWRNVQASIPLHNGATANVVKLIEENL